MPDSKLTLDRKLTQRKLKTPPAVIYPLLANLWKLLFMKKLGAHIKYEVDIKKLKGAYIVVSNHASRLDYIYTGAAFLPHRLNYVAGYNEFFRSHLAFIFRLLQVIPKKNFTPDLYMIREFTRIIKSGGRVIIFPEGMSSISGGNQPCAIGSGKLLKHFGVPVLMTKISGGYLTSTKYCLDERDGMIDMTVSRLFTPEQLEAMTADEIQHALDVAIHHDDYEWNKVEQAAYDCHGEVAKNLHTLLYWCPRCGGELTMHGEGNVIKCRSCGNGATLDDKYNLRPLDGDCVIPDTPKAWFDMERARAKKLVADESFTLTENVKLGTLPKYKYLKNQATSEIVGEGVLTLSRNGLCYSGTRDGKPFEFTLKPHQVPTFGMCTDVSRFYTFYQGEFMEFYPERESVGLWLHATEEMHRVCGGEWKDFDF